MTESLHDRLLAKYSVPNMGEHTAAGGPVATILERLDTKGRLPAEDLKFLRDKGLFDLCTFVERLEETGRADFGILRAPVERRERLSEERALRERYQIDYFEREDKRRLFGILRAVERGARLRDEDVVWLKERELLSDALRRVFHEHEAKYHCVRFEQGGDPWEAVNASSHFRKAGSPSDAVAVLERVDLDTRRDSHLKSAVCTTRGGALRDLGRFQDAVVSAEQAHGFEPKSFHPCTLLGALFYELGRRAEGDAWFARAVERGAKPESIDQELRAILRRASGPRREEMTRHLLAVDPQRYAWVRDVEQGRVGARGRKRHGRPRS
jgi:hypothetical protein